MALRSRKYTLANQKSAHAVKSEKPEILSPTHFYFCIVKYTLKQKVNQALSLHLLTYFNIFCKYIFSQSFLNFTREISLKYTECTVKFSDNRLISQQSLQKSLLSLIFKINYDKIP